MDLLHNVDFCHFYAWIHSCSVVQLSIVMNGCTWVCTVLAYCVRLYACLYKHGIYLHLLLWAAVCYKFLGMEICLQFMLVLCPHRHEASCLLSFRLGCIRMNSELFHKKKKCSKFLFLGHAIMQWIAQCTQTLHVVEVVAAFLFFFFYGKHMSLLSKIRGSLTQWSTVPLMIVHFFPND